MELLISDGELRRQFREDPDAAIRRSGLTLDDEDREMLQQTETGGSGEQLRQRISKGGGNWGG
jgi:hypothetical protein